MKRKNALLAALACALAFCLALAGCGGTASDPEAPYVGYWTFAEGEVDGEDMGELLDQLQELMGTDVHFILHLEAGGTGVIDMYGEVEDLTWDAEDKTITVSGEDQSFELDGEQLRLTGEDEGDYLLFDKSDEDLSDTIERDKEAAEEAAANADDSSSTSDEAGTSQAIEAITVADDDTCTIQVTELAVDDYGDVGFTVKMTNNTDKRITIMIPANVTAVNGTMCELYGTATLLAGTNATEFFYFMSSDGVVTSIEDLVNVQTTFQVYDAETYDDLGSYEVTINGTGDAAATNTTEAQEAMQEIDPVTVADDDVCTIVVTYKEVDGDGDAGFVASFTNNGSTTISLYSPIGTTNIDGTAHELWTYNASDVPAGETRTILLYFDDVSSIDDLVNTQVTVVPYDSDTWEDIRSYTAIIP